MFESIIRFSIKYKFLVFVLVLGIIGGGIYSVGQLAIDAVPDITNNQVQVVTVSPSLAPQEVEQYITFPVELSVANIPQVQEIRSISRYGLSVVTIVFDDRMPILDARQYVSEQIKLATEEIPDNLGTPELMPITTGLGEIYQYTLDVKDGYDSLYSDMELRTIQDWIVKRQLAGIPGIIEVSSFGGYLKQYEVSIDPVLLRYHDLTIADVYEALMQNNQNSGGSYIEKSTNAYYIRTEGRVESIDEIKQIQVKSTKTPVRIRDIAKVQFGSPKRYGAMTKNGKGEVVGGITLMLKGANSSEAITNVQNRVALVQQSLPEGVYINPYLDRSDLVGRAIDTVKNNLLEGGLIVILVLVLLLGNIRAGIIVASIIPLSLLFAFIMMNVFGVSANLMSLGAIDFGIVVDGAVIIVESILYVIYTHHLGEKLSQQKMDKVISDASAKIYKSAAFGVLIILVVFLPIISLTGIEGKMFRPMAYTVSFAILGAMLLSMTYVPVMASLVLNKNIKAHHSFADKIMDKLRSVYFPSIRYALNHYTLIFTLSVLLLGLSFFTFSRMGSEFIPTLEEGDLAMQMTIQPGSSLKESISTSSRAEKILLDNFPEVTSVISKIGTAEVPTDPMAIEDADIMILLKNKDEWTSASTREELADKMKESLDVIVGASFEFTQPIQLRFNELMTGAKTDIAIKIFGEDTDELARLARILKRSIEDVRGAADIKIEQTNGLPQLLIRPERGKLAQFGVSVEDINQVIRAAYAGENAGVVFEEEKKFDLVVRANQANRSNLNLDQLFVRNQQNNLIPVRELTTIEEIDGPMQISREDTKRRITVGVNVRNRDVASLVEEIKGRVDKHVKMPAGYYVTYGGEFENLEAARARLIIAVPIALFMIFILLFTAFQSLKYASIIFTAVPFSAIGGIYALYFRDMPFSISAGVGFIALFGVAVLNGIVLISYLNELKEEKRLPLKELIMKGSANRLRPVLMTAGVAAFGFLPMALSSTAGAEVQKPLATVVIGGLLSSTLLTLIVLPTLYYYFNRKSYKIIAGLLLIGFTMLSPGTTQAQDTLSLEMAQKLAADNHYMILGQELEVEKAKVEKSNAYRPGNTVFNYQRGNINSFFNDYQWNISQSLGNPFSAASEGKSKTYKVASQENLVTLHKRQVAFETAVIWLNWHYNQRKLELLDSLQQEIEIFENGIDDAIKKGEINLATSQIWKQLNIQLSQSYFEVSQLAKSDYSRLKTFCNVDREYLPGSHQLVTQSVGLNDISDDFETYFQNKESEWEYQEKAIKNEIIPAISVGYFEQQIDGIEGLRGWNLSLQMPLYFFNVKKEATIASLNKEQVQHQRDFEIRMKNNELEQVIRINQELNTILSSLEDSNVPFDQLKNALSEGEINLYQYLNTLSIGVDNQLTRWDLKKRYAINQQRIKYLTK